ncbi:MAG: thioredoxin domain-containing protein [Planctomycetaceae bacterium]
MKLIALLTMLAADFNSEPLPDVVLLDFAASYCGPCQQMVPVLQRMEKDHFPIRKIDITQHPDVTRKYNVDRIPTLILLVEGREAQRFVGLRSEDELRQAMNDAARKLDDRRRAAGAAERPATAAASSEPDGQKQVQTDSQARPGLRGLFDRMKSGLTGESRSGGDRNQTPEFRAQSPEPELKTDDLSAPMAATVRVRLLDGDMRDVGTGTLIFSTAGRSIVLTCAHIFQKVGKDAVVEVDVFQDGKVLKYPARVLGGDHESDVSLLEIQTASALPTAPVAYDRQPLEKQEQLFSIGCSHGDLPTRLNMNVIEVNRYIGPENILCTNDPAQGRSGGGLFDGEQRLVGVCSAADRKSQEGLYTGVKPIQKLLTQLKLDSVVASGKSPTAVEEAASVFRELEEQEVATSSHDNLAEDLFGELDGVAGSFEDFAEAAGTATNGRTGLSATQAPQSLPDPFARTQTSSTASPEPTTGSTATPTEITVIIDSPDPSQGKRVIVIPRPSPWLIELLTGDRPTNANSAIAGQRQRVLSVTSDRTPSTGSTTRN